MKAIVLLLALSAVLPTAFVPGAAAPDDTAVVQGLERCGGCGPTLGFEIVQEPPIPCRPGKDWIASMKFVNTNAGHGGGDCGECVDLRRNVCRYNADETCTIDATVEVTLNFGGSWSAVNPGMQTLTFPIKITKTCGSGVVTQAFTVFALDCSFKVRFKFTCDRCSCPQIA